MISHHSLSCVFGSFSAVFGSARLLSVVSVIRRTNLWNCIQIFKYGTAHRFSCTILHFLAATRTKDTQIGGTFASVCKARVQTKSVV